jgi:hypothetical protein
MTVIRLEWSGFEFEMRRICRGTRIGFMLFPHTGRAWIDLAWLHIALWDAQGGKA